MTKDQEKTLEQELNQYALLWRTTPAQGNEDAVKSYRDQVFLLAYKRYGQLEPSGQSESDSNAFMDAFVEALTHYAPERGPFCSYLSFLLKQRKIDAYRKDSLHAPSGVSLDHPVSAEDAGMTLGSIIPADSSCEPERMAEFDSRFADLTAMVLNFSARHPGRSGSPEHRMWCRMFYTEDLTWVMKQHTFHFLHERDVFQAMDTEYLDYYMSRICRTGKEVMAAPLKPYREVVPERTEPEETPLPLNADVSLSFLRRCRNVKVGASVRSNHIKKYEAEKQDLYHP